MSEATGGTLAASITVRHFQALERQVVKYLMMPLASYCPEQAVMGQRETYCLRRGDGRRSNENFSNNRHGVGVAFIDGIMRIVIGLEVRRLKDRQDKPSAVYNGPPRKSMYYK